MEARRTRWVLLCTITIGLVGCQKPASPPASQAAEPEIVLKAPQDAARTLVNLIRAHLQAVARHDRAGADRIRDRIVERVVARTEILERYRLIAGRAAQDEEGILRALVENWAAVINYYADGLAADQMQVAATGAATGAAVVEIPALGRDDQAVLRVTCRSETDDQWRVTRIELGPTRPAPATAPAPPASQPQTAPASEPASRPG